MSGNVYDWVKEVNEGFELHEMPEFMTEADKERFLTEGEKYKPPKIGIFSSVRRAFPLFGILENNNVFSGGQGRYFKQQLKGRDLRHDILHANAQEMSAKDAVFFIDMAGKMVKSLEYWARGESWEDLDPTLEPHLWERVKEFIPQDSACNSMRKRYKLEFQRIDHPLKFIRQGNLDGFPELRAYGHDRLIGLFLTNYGETLGRDLDALLDVDRKGYGGGSLRDLLKTDRESFMRFYGSLRKIHEEGSAELKKASAVDKSKSLKWEYVFPEDLQEGDIVAGMWSERGKERGVFRGKTEEDKYKFESIPFQEHDVSRLVSFSPEIMEKSYIWKLQS